ncbi:MAG: NTP transferase domain-containing protein [Candidatus Odinarchaeota archaeon]
MKISAIIMAGGKNSRFNFNKLSQNPKEKLMLPLGDNRIIDYSIKAALNTKYISQLIVATSPYTKVTQEYIKQKYQKLSIVETEGKGYIEDIHSIVKLFNLAEVLTMVGDTPFITSKVLKNIIKTYFHLKYEALSVMIPVKSFQKHGLRIPSKHIFFENGERVISAGFNIIDGRKTVLDQLSQVNIILDDIKLMYNINTVEDYIQAKLFYKKLNLKNRKRFFQES